jgi:uncharacterized protein (UPF0333 family)
MSLLKKSKGQAMVEYLLVVVFLITLTIKVVGGFTSFMATTVGNLGHVLTYRLTVGVCNTECFYKGYGNGRSQ